LFKEDPAAENAISGGGSGFGPFDVGERGLLFPSPCRSSLCSCCMNELLFLLLLVLLLVILLLLSLLLLPPLLFDWEFHDVLGPRWVVPTDRLDALFSVTRTYHGLPVTGTLRNVHPTEKAPRECGAYVSS
jgi:hypothetical protein